MPDAIAKNTSLDTINQLIEWRRLHGYLYNACLDHRITSYRRFGQSVGYLDQQNVLPAFKECWPEYVPRKCGVAKLYFLRKHEATWGQEAQETPRLLSQGGS